VQGAKLLAVELKLAWRHERYNQFLLGTEDFRGAKYG
jgi:hypothetical protein